MIHALRVGLFVAIILLIRRQHVAWHTQQTLLRSASVPIQRLQKFFPTAREIGGWDRQHDAQIVATSNGTTLGYVVQTSPASDHVIGYSGPTNVLIAFDKQNRVVGIEVLESRDTREHVADVTSDTRFMHAYDRLNWQEAAALRDVDGVSGATLTSLAIVEAISQRLGRPSPSLRFPQPLSVSELTKVLPQAARLCPRPLQQLVCDVLDEHGQPIGSVVRTSPTGDGVTGYQGPTDALIVFDAEHRVARVLIRSSYDNQPYVKYVCDDEYFATLFNRLDLSQLGTFDLQAADVEGVSGATMTSMAVARSLTQAAAAAAVRQEPARLFVVSARDGGTCVILVLGLVMTFSHLRGRPRVRRLFRLVLVGYLGFINGDMLSQTLLVGWAQGGVPWRLAPGLVLLSSAALLVPVLSKRQLYCHHVCPFGAAQQLIAPRADRRWRVPGRIRRVLSVIPPALLLLVVLTAMLHLPINLASIEPFDAFFFWIAGTATLLIALVGLIGSAIVPMGYCRFGCPTGAMLDYLRFRGSSDRLAGRDLLAVALVALAWLL